MPDLAPVKIKFKGDLKDLRASFSRAKDESRKSTNAIAKNFDELGKNLQRTGKRMTVAVTAPFVAFSALTTKTFAKFERSMQTIVGLVGIAQGQVDEWTKSILRLGPAVGRGPVELADAMFFITSAGIRGQAALDALTLSAKGAASGLGETKSVALAVVSAVNTWADSGMTAAMATDIMVKTIREGNLEAGSLAGSLGKLLGTAKAAGATFADVGAAIAVMSQQGLNADLATTALNAVFGILLSSGAETEKMLDSVGLTLEDLRRQLREEGLLVLLQSLSEAFQGNKSALAELIPEKRAFRAILSITGQEAEKVGAIFDSVRDSTGALDEAFAAMAGTADLRLNQASARLQGSMIRFGDTLKMVVIPATEEFSGALEDLSTRLSETSEATKETIAGLVAVMAAIGPTLFAVGALSISFAKLKTSALVTTVLASVKDSLTFVRLEFVKAATAGEVFNAVLFKTKAIAGGLTIVIAAIAVAFAAIMKSVREAGKAIEDSTDAIVRARTAYTPWIAKIEELKKANFEMFQEWRTRVRELVAGGMETRIAWVKAWTEMEITERLAQQATEDATMALEDQAEAAKAAADAIKRLGLQEQLEQLRLEVRTPEEELEETLAGLDRFRVALAAVGIEGEAVEEVLGRAAARARELLGESREGKVFSSVLERIREQCVRLREELRRSAEETREQFERLRLSVRTPAEALAETTAQLEELRAKLAAIGMTGDHVEEILARLAEQAAEKFKDATTQVEKTSDAVRSLGLTFSSAFENAIVAGKGLRAILRGLEEDVLRIFLRKTITEPLGAELAGMFAGLFPAPSAAGTVFSGGRVQPFRGGGVIGGPVAFPLVGGVGIAGETGPEAIMPLQRTSRGELGVRAVGATGPSMVIHEGDLILQVSAIDSRDVARFFEEHSSRVGAAVLREVRGSQRYRQQLMRG